MKRKIISAPQSVLNNPAKTVTVFDKKLKNLISDMEETLIATRNPKGVGLAAPQIAEPWRIFVTRPTSRDPVRAFINPEIVSFSGDDKKPADDDKKLEGCLSIPKVWGKVSRHFSLILRYQDTEGVVHEERFSGFFATIIQHETDHINGILFTQRVLEQKGGLFQAVINDKGKEELEEIKI
jgi:peptide deformylase